MAKETTKAKTRHTAKASGVALGAPKVTKCTPAPKQAIQKKRKPNTAVFGSDAPSARLRMPQHDDVTAAEMIVFLPNSIRSHDFLYRLMQNGLDTPTLTMIVNFHRRPTKGGPIPINSFCKIIEKTMRDAGHEKWTVGKHKAGEFEVGPKPWNGNSLSCRGYRLNCEEFPKKKPNEGGVLENMPFAGLAHDVERYPSEETGDALDLSRCVKYAVANSHLPLQFPRDFGFLKRLTGGPSRVTAAHRDFCVFNRWRISSRKVEYIADADVTGFDMMEHKFSAEQEAIVNNYLERMENGEDPGSAESSETSNSPSAFTQASDHNSAPSIKVEASEDSGYSFVLTHTSEGGRSESILPQSSEDCEDFNSIQSSEDDIENCPVQGHENVRNQSGPAIPSSLLDGHEIRLSAQQPAQYPTQQYEGYSMPYFPSSAEWNHAFTEYSTTESVAPIVPNVDVTQYAQAYDYPNQVAEYPGQVENYSGQVQDYSGQAQDYFGQAQDYFNQAQDYTDQIQSYPNQGQLSQQYNGNGYQVGYNDPTFAEPMSRANSAGYTYNNDRNTGSGYV